MIEASNNDLDYLATRLHARRSRMAEAERLNALCRIRSVAELANIVFPNAEISSTAEFQRRLVFELTAEIYGCLKHLDPHDQEFVEWLLARFQVENVKILLRGFTNHSPLSVLAPHLMRLPPELALDGASLLAATSITEFAGRLPAGGPRKRLLTFLANSGESSPLFLLEAALDAGYFAGLTARTGRLSGYEHEIVTPLIFQEVNSFQFMLAVRGRFNFHLTAPSLLPLGLRGCGVGPEWFNALLSVPDLMSAAKNAAGVVIDELPRQQPTDDGPPAVEISTLEMLIQQRFLRLANTAFRRSHMGVGAVAGYFGLRRVEIANLITLSESIRLGLDAREMRMHMTSCHDLEAFHV